MIKRVILLIQIAGTIALAERPIDELLYDATCYGNTAERREAKQAALEELRNRMPGSLRAAMNWAHGDNVMIQVLLMEWVQSQPAEVVVPVMLDFIDHEREDTRKLALFFLGFKDAPEHAEKVIPHLENEATRGAALRTLGKWKIKEARPAAKRWLVDGNERVRVVAANALRDIGDPDAIETLVIALNDPVFTVRNTAARAIVILAGSRLEWIPAAVAGYRLIDRIRLDAGLSGEDQGVLLDGRFFVP